MKYFFLNFVLMITISSCMDEQSKSSINQKISLLAIDTNSLSNHSSYLQIFQIENNNFYIKNNDLNKDWSENYYANSVQILEDNTVKIIPHTSLGISLWKKQNYLGNKNLLIYCRFKDNYVLDSAEFEILNFDPRKKIQISFEADTLLYDCCENNLIDLSFIPIGVDYFVKDTISFNIKNGMIYIDDEIYLDSLIIDTLNNRITTYSSDAQLAIRNYSIINEGY